MSERIEHDSMGEVRVPADALWGAQTARAVENFPISGLTMPPPIVHALARIKAAAARVNADLGALDADRAGAIEAAAREVAAGRHDEHFPIDVFQTGSGTSTNMNVNEVVARLAHLQSGPGHPPQRPRQRRPVLQRHVPHRHPPGRRHRRGAGAGAGAGAPGGVPAAQGGRVRLRRQGRPHAPDGRGAGDPGPGVLRLRPSGRARRGRGSCRPPTAPPSCRWAARRPAPGSTPLPGSPPR